MADQTTAEALAAHPRWEWREGVRPRDEGPYTRITPQVAHKLAGPVARMESGVVPDLADDATAGIVRGMVREWCDNHADALFSTVYHRGEWSVLITARGLYQAPFAAPTLGEAAGRCLLACWEYDAADGGAR